MIATGHNAVGTTVGVIVASQTSDPASGIIWAIIVGLLLHYLLDAIPHGHPIDSKQYGKLPPALFVDLFGSFIIFYGITLLKFGLGGESFIILIAIGASQ